MEILQVTRNIEAKQVIEKIKAWKTPDDKDHDEDEYGLNNSQDYLLSTLLSDDFSRWMKQRQSMLCINFQTFFHELYQVDAIGQNLY